MANTPQSTGRQRASGKWVMISIVTAMVVLFIAGISLFFGGEPTGAQDIGTADISAPDDPGTIGGKGSVEYNKKLIEQDKIDASLAREKGKSRVATLVGNGENNGQLDLIKRTEIKRKEFKPPEPLKRTQSNTGRRRPNVNPEPPIAPEYSSQMSSILGLMTAQAAVTTIYTSKESEPEKKEKGDLNDNGSDDAKAKASQQEKVDNKPPLNLSPRSILYAVNDLRLNSDIRSSHVRATILAGEYKGAVINGSFSRYEGKLTLSFNQLVTTDDVVYSINGFAIDPDTTEASVASDVDWHYISRWGGLASAAFLEGLGDAVKSSGQQMTSGIGGQVIQANPQYSLMDKGAIAVGNVASRVGSILQKNFSRPPTVTLEPGITMGIIILSAS